MRIVRMLVGLLAMGVLTAGCEGELPPLAWARLPEPLPPARSNAAMASDPDRGDRLVLFGGECAGGLCGDTWIFGPPEGDEAAEPIWTLLTDGTARAHHTLGWDPGGDARSLLSFGGRDGSAVGTGVPPFTWRLAPGDPTSWSASTIAAPGSLVDSAMVALPQRGLLLAFGGWDEEAEAATDGTWTLGTNQTTGAREWVRQTGGPPPRRAHTLTAVRCGTLDFAVLYGGTASAPGGRGGIVGDLWLWDGAWRQPGIEQDTERPPERTGHGAAFLPADARAEQQGACGRLVVFGGRTEDGRRLDDLWALEVRSDGPWWWTQLDPVSRERPMARSGATLAYDPRWDRLVLEGGRGETDAALGDAWSLETVDEQSYYATGCESGAGPAGLLALALVLLWLRPRRVAAAGRRRRALGPAWLLLAMLATPSAAWAAAQETPPRASAKDASERGTGTAPRERDVPEGAGDAPAGAATGRAVTPKRVRLAFLGLRAGAGVEPPEVEALSEFTQTELGRLGVYDVISTADVQTLLGLEAQRQLLGCEEDGSCIAELAGALGADRVLSGNVARVGDTLLVNLVLMDVSAARVVGRDGRRVAAAESSVEPVIDAIPGLLRTLARSDAAVEPPEAAPTPAGAEATPPGSAPPASARDTGASLLLAARGDVDVLESSFAPGLTVTGYGLGVGLSATVLFLANDRAELLPSDPADWLSRPVLLRLEVRSMPTGRAVSPYFLLGAVAPLPDLGVRGGLGLMYRLGPVSLFAEVAYEHFLLLSAPGVYRPQAVVVGAGAGWRLGL